MNPYSQLFDSISSLISWTAEEQIAFGQLLRLRIYTAGEYLIREGEACDNLYFINKGLVCNMIEGKNGNELAVHFIWEDNFATNLVGFSGNRPSIGHLKALEDTTCVVIHRQALNWLYDNVKEGNKLVRIKFEQLYEWLIKREHLNYIDKPLERYELMLRMYPEIEKRVSQKIISSFLNIDQAHFSRIKQP